MKPPSNVMNKLIIINKITWLKLKNARLESEVRFFIIIFTGIINSFVILIIECF